MPLPDASIIQWSRGYPNDTNIPLGTDIIGTNLDDQFRLIKSVERDESVNKGWERWSGLYGTLAFVDGTHFTLTGNQLLSNGGPVDLNRRVKCTLASTIIQGMIVDADFNGTITTVAVAMDGTGALDNGLSEVQFGIADEAIPGDVQRAGFTPYFGIAAGTDTYTVNFTPPLQAYSTGLLMIVKIINANTVSAPTLNINGLGAKVIVKLDGSALSAGSLAAGMMALLVYDGATDRLQLVDTLGGSTPATPGTTPIGSSGTVANLGGTYSKQFSAGGIGNAAGGGNTTLFTATFLANSFDQNGKFFTLTTSGTFTSNTNNKFIRLSVGGAITSIQGFVQGPISGLAWWYSKFTGVRVSATQMIITYDSPGGNGISLITVANLTTNNLVITLIGASQVANQVKANLYLLEFWN